MPSWDIVVGLEHKKKPSSYKKEYTKFIRYAIVHWFGRNSKGYKIYDINEFIDEVSTTHPTENTLGKQEAE